MKISLCIPTNGVVEWISQVIDSIYAQGVSIEQFEVVIVDNGDNPVFYEYIQKKMDEYSNIRYKKTASPLFMNEIETYKMAEGDFIKFVNHRTVLLDGTLKKWVSFMQENIETKPVVYFANGELDKKYSVYYYDSFDGFVGALSYYSSWSTGMAMWKEDIENTDIGMLNELFPHTSILFKNRRSKKYIVDNTIYLQEIPHTSKKKGKYDLFNAFAVEYPSILLELYRSKDISLDTFLKLKDENLDFIIELHKDFCIDKVECSYDLSSYEKSIQVFYSNAMVFDRLGSKDRLFQEELEKRLNRMNKLSDVKIIYGAGKAGRKYVTENGEDGIVCFIDKSKYKQGKLVLGIPVISLEEYLNTNINGKVCVCVKKQHFCEEERTLKEAGKEFAYWESV